VHGVRADRIGVSRTVWFHRGRPGEIARLDLTGGEAVVVKLTDDGTPKVLLQFSKGGVLVEVALDRKAAAAFGASFDETLRWVEDGGPDA
jgi:uncharacterized protein (AIM24 family)